MTAPWIKVRGDNLTLTVFCERCGKSATFKLPISVTDCVAMTDAFVRAHKECKPTIPVTTLPVAASEDGVSSRASCPSVEK